MIRLSNILEIVLIGFYMYGVFFRFHYFLFFVGFIAIVFYRLTLYLNKKNKWKFKEFHKCLILIGLILSFTGGNIFRLYMVLPQLDKTHHLFFPIGLVIIINHIYKKYNLEVGDRLMMVFFTVMTLCLMVEFIEFAADKLLDGAIMQGVFLFNGEVIQTPIDDTMIDLFLGMIGAVIGLIGLKWKE